MIRQRKISRPSPWPIWLLVAAWFCANCPQTLICAAVVWLGEAHSFDHQQRLKSDVAHLLVGEKPHSFLAHVPVVPPAPAKSTLPPGPALKKIELAAEETLTWLAPVEFAPWQTCLAMRTASALRAPPLLGPPRDELAG